jgi:transcription termination factor NusA
MTSTEIEVLKIIWDQKGKASVMKISNALKISTDYARLLFRDLLKDKFVEFSEGQYKITDLGKKELKKQGMIESIKKVPSPKKPKRKTLVKKKIKKAIIRELSGLSPKLIKVLEKKGFKTLEDIATTSVSRLVEAIEDLNLKKAAEMINEARAKLRKERKEYLWEE